MYNFTLFSKCVFCLSVSNGIFVSVSLSPSVPLTSFLGYGGNLLQLWGEVEGVKVVHLVAGEALEGGGGGGGGDRGDGRVGAADGTLCAGQT